MEKFTIKKPSTFHSEHIFECGQCFRWEKDEDGNYIGVVGNTVIKVVESNEEITFYGNFIDESKAFKEIIIEYFDFEIEYENYKDKLMAIDDNLKKSIEFGYGIRILRQELWETIISFIISANNNIPRIKKIINNLCTNYGKKIVFENKDYYTFPSVEALSNVTIDEFRKLGLGFRDKRVYNTTKMIRDGVINLDELSAMDNTEKMRDVLLQLDGVGPKVADCILLFSLHRLDVFPIDVWVRRVMNDLYIHNNDENKVSKKEIISIAEDKFGKIKGLAQQYLFYWKREE